MATHPAARKHPTVVFYGDSFVTGWRGTTTPQARWSSRVSEALGGARSTSRSTGWGTTRRRSPRGVDGQREPSASDMTLLDSAVRLEPDAVVVCLGANDVRFLPQDASLVQDAIESLHAKLALELPTTPVLATSYFPSRQLSPRAAQISSWIASAVERSGHTHFTEFHCGAAEAPDLLCDDGVHPNDAGHEALADAILPACERPLRPPPQWTHTPVEYVRFESPTPSRRGNHLGVFMLANKLAHAGILTDDDYAWWRRNNDWCNAAYVNPSTLDSTVYDWEANPGAQAWFKSSATHLIAKAREYLQLLDRYDVSWVERRTVSPGRVVYEDSVQVIAVPARNS